MSVISFPSTGQESPSPGIELTSLMQDFLNSGYLFHCVDIFLSERSCTQRTEGKAKNGEEGRLYIPRSTKKP